MPLAPGSRLGPYEILEPLGSGGMGQVYKARDTRLGRSVAIKVLHPSLAADPSFAARFANEARALSQISHPHICVLHDVGHGDPLFLVLEYLEGETLADRIARGALTVDELRRIGVEICRALETAHRAGIVHRDLKPANVMLTRSGAKLLDFGLARDDRRADDENLTTAVALTRVGTTVGTAAYMSPEQLHGQRVDARSDIFALGIVLYEMATGTRPFSGDTPAGLAAAILSLEPPAVSARRPGLPPALDAIVQGCLAKEPDARWQAAHDVGRQLESMLSSSSHGVPAVQKRATIAAFLPWALTALAVAIAAVAWARRETAPAAGAPTVALEIFAAPGTSQLDTVEGNAFALSPDGSQLAWVAVDAHRRSQIWIRPLAQVDAHPLTGTEGASTLFWSPDSRSIAFFANGLLQRLDLQGTSPVTVCPVNVGSGYAGTWGEDGRMLFAPIQGDAIYSVSTAGGTPQKFITANRSAGERRVGWPWFLADGRSFVYSLRLENGSWLMLARPGRGPERVSEMLTQAQYADGYLVFGRNGALLAQRFDTASGRLSGDPLPLGSKVQLFAASGWGAFSVSRGGTIAFRMTSDEAQLAVTDESGGVVNRLSATGDYLDVRLTPDGQHALTSRIDPGSGAYDIWSVDLTTGTETRVTAGPSTSIAGILSRDGETMIYSKTTGGAPELFRRQVAGGAEERIAPAEAFQEAQSITRNGRTLLYTQRADRGDWDLLTVPVDGREAPRPFLATGFNELDARLSPDDRLVAFTSDETGRSEVYLATFPQAGQKYRVSGQGGRAPRWSADGRTLLFLAGDGRLMRAVVAPAGAPRADPPVSAFTEPPTVAWRNYVPLPGGRILAIVPNALTREQPTTVITNAVK